MGRNEQKCRRFLKEGSEMLKTRGGGECWGEKCGSRKKGGKVRERGPLFVMSTYLVSSWL